MADRRRRPAAELPSAALDTALHQQGEQSQNDREKFGVLLNTVTSAVCPSCGRQQRMTVHPACRVYQLCKHSFPLPPLPVDRTYEARRRSGAKPKGAAR